MTSPARSKTLTTLRREIRAGLITKPDEFYIRALQLGEDPEGPAFQAAVEKAGLGEWLPASCRRARPGASADTNWSFDLALVARVREAGYRVAADLAGSALLDRLEDLYESVIGHEADCARKGHPAAECTCLRGELADALEAAGRNV